MFPGFTDSETFTPIPDSFFRQLLASITDPDELKVTLYALWRVGNMEGSVHFLREQDFVPLLPDPGPALEKAVTRGSLLKALPPSSARGKPDQAGPLFFLNSPRGRAAAKSYSAGKWQPGTATSAPLPKERPNIFRLY